MKTKTNSKGWIPDLPDFRDYDPNSDEVKTLLKKVGIQSEKKKKLPKKKGKQKTGF